MKRTVYKNRFLVNQSMLNYTESSKIEEILLHSEVLGDDGVIQGLNVFPSTAGDGTISVTSGSVVLPNREILNLSVERQGISLASSVDGDLNIVAIEYRESLSGPKISRTGDNNNLVFADPNPRLRVFTIDNFTSLTEEERSILAPIAIVEAEGDGVAIPLANIFTVPNNLNLIDFSEFEILKGVVLLATSVTPTSKEGSIRYDMNNGTLSFVSPNNPSPPPTNAHSLGSIQVDTTQTDPVRLFLFDPSAFGDWIFVEVYGLSLPNSSNSFEETFLEEMEENERINGTYINENLSFRGLYTQGLTEISDGIIVETKKHSAVDRRHRELLGTGLTTSKNPHGLSLRDIVSIFENVPGNMRLGDSLLNTSEEGVYPRITATAADVSRYTLLFESELPEQGQRGVSPARIYISPNSIFLTVNAKFNPSTLQWEKDNVLYPDIPAIRVILGMNEFSVSYNNVTTPFADDATGWTERLLTTEEDTLIRDSLIVKPKSNNEHNRTSENIFTGLINAGRIGALSNRANKLPIYEDKNSENGGLRIYMGRDFSRHSGSNVIEFTHNCKNLESNPAIWRKDIPASPAYVFRFVFNEDTSSLDLLESLRYSGTFETFGDNLLSLVSINFPTGLESGEEEEGSFNTGIRINSLITYSSFKEKRLVVPFANVGYRGASALAVNFETAGYFDAPAGIQSILDPGLPARLLLESRDKNQNSTFVPKLWWFGPERPWVRESTVAYIGTQRFPSNFIHKFTFPLNFSEIQADIYSMSISWDWVRYGLRTSFPPEFNDLGYQRQQFFWGDDLDPSNRWMRFNLVNVNYLTDSSVTANPTVTYPSHPISWENIDDTNEASSNRVIRFRNPSGDPLFTYNRLSLSPYSQLQLHIETDRTFLDSLGPVIDYRPILMGNLIVHYRTRYLD